MSFWRKKNIDHPDPDINEYLKLNAKAQANSLFEQEYCVLDFETTGLDPEKDQIVSFAFLKIRNEEILLNECMEGYLNSSGEHKGAEIHQVMEAERHSGMGEVQ